MVKQSTTRHKHVTVIVKVVLVVEICIACDKMFAVCRDEFKQNRKTKKVVCMTCHTCHKPIYKKRESIYIYIYINIYIYIYIYIYTALLENVL